MKKIQRRRSRKHDFKRRSQPGAMPGTLSVDPNSPMPVIHVIGYGPDLLKEANVSEPAALRDFLNRFPVVWVDIDGLGDANVLQQLADIFHLHPLAMEDVVNTHQRAKVDDYGDNLFITTRFPRETTRVETEQVSIFLGQNFVLTFQEHRGDCFDPVRQRIRATQGRFRERGADYLAYTLIDSAIDSYFPVIERFGDRLEDLDDLIASKSTPTTISLIHDARADLLNLRRAIRPHREAVNSLARDEFPLVTADTRIYLRDCYDHTVQIIDLLENYRETCSDLRDFHLATVSNRMNDIMKVLTIISTIFIPLGFIAGVYGMNFDNSVSPWNMPELKWYFGYPLVLGFMALVAALLLWLFKARGWIGNNSFMPSAHQPGTGTAGNIKRNA